MTEQSRTEKSNRAGAPIADSATTATPVQAPPPTTRPGARPDRGGPEGGQTRAGWLFIAPFGIFFVLFLLWPVVYMLITSFFDTSLVHTGFGTFIGLGNYQEMLTRAEFWSALWHTIQFTIYTVPPLVILAFVWAPLSVWTAYAFGIAMGLLWLSTVPLTNGTVATLFGVRNLSMLGGITFLFHQIGAFLGGWLGGYVYDHTGNYDLVWRIAILLSLLAGLLNWPVRERPVARLGAAEVA